MTTRAAPLAPDQRRAAILAAATPLIKDHGRGITTKQIAQAAGIAEGTIFRVFASKDELLADALEEVLDPSTFLSDLASAKLGDGLQADLLTLTTMLHGRLSGVFAVMIALGIGPPMKSANQLANKSARKADSEHAKPGHADPLKQRVGALHEKHGDWRQRAEDLMIARLKPYADQLRRPVAEVVHLTRLLTFAGSHPHISANHQLTPAEIVDVVLHGTLAPGRNNPC